jgi:hypothetical protein
MHVCVCIYVCIHIQACAFAYVRVSMRASARMYAHILQCFCKVSGEASALCSSRMCACTYLCVYIGVHVCACMCMPNTACGKLQTEHYHHHMYVYVCTRMNVDTQTGNRHQIYAYLHTCMHACSYVCTFFSYVWAHLALLPESCKRSIMVVIMIRRRALIINDRKKWKWLGALVTGDHGGWLWDQNIVLDVWRILVVFVLVFLTESHEN